MQFEGLRLSRSIVGEAEAAAVSRVLLDDGYLGMGGEVQRFEEELACYLNVKPWQVITVNSGTAALHLAVDAVCPRGTEVLVPSLTFLASFQAIMAADCTPVACEVDPSSCTIDLKDAAQRLTQRTSAIMPVHYASNPWQLEAVYDFAATHHLRVIEDAAHAFGCTRNGKKIGSFGDMVCFSFDGIKNITCGEGGCVIAHDREAARLCSDARLLAVQNDADKRFKGARSWDFDVTRQGWRYHMSNIMAAIGRVQLGRLDGEFAPARRALAALSGTFGRERGVALLAQDADCMIIPHIFCVRVLDGRLDTAKAALAAAGVPTGMHYKPNHLLSLFGKGQPPLPITEGLYQELLTLPLHPGITPAQVDGICSVLLKAVA